ncbi:MAG: response regulator transcription factor [Flavobacteriales bacterium]|nr:response regulator transcription factor [Flavobacteriales bacterium]
MEQTRVVIFDDNKSRRDSLQALISMYDDLVFAGMFENCVDVERNIRETKPDVVLMDIEMPVVNGLEGVLIIHQKFPNIAVIMQTVFEDDDKVFESLRFGACGYILKKTSPDKIIEAIRDAREGGAPMTPAIAQRVLNYFIRKQPIATNDYELTNREKEILGLLVEGKSYKMIASETNTSYHTVNAHIRKIYDKLHVHSVSEAVSKALKERLI